MKRVLWMRGAWFWVMFLAVNLQAQSPMAEAITMMQAKEFDKASKTLEEIVQREPENGMAWTRLGTAYLSMKKFDPAIRCYSKADALAFAPAIVRYNLACAYALSGRKKEALDWLGKAMESGYAQPDALKSDDDLKSLHGEPGFDALVKMAEKNAKPCEYDEKRRAFDFWIGAWDVFNPHGQQIGFNVIEKEVGGCMLHERWTSATGAKGESINYFDPAAGKWKQNWVNASGGIVRYEGEVRNGAMHFMGENIGPDGKITAARVTLSPQADGSVSHIIETSTDGGTTWTVSFNGKYIRQTDHQ